MSEPLTPEPAPICVIVCGSRSWPFAEVIRCYIDSLPTGSTVITGGATGADALAAKFARERGLESIVVFADWAAFGRGAGPRRNAEMLSMCPDAVRAFRLSGTSRGTDDMIRRARALGVPVEVING